MEKLLIKTELGESKLLLGEKLSNLHTYLPNSKLIIITDENVNRIYGNQFPKAASVIVIGLGELNKTIATTETIFEKFIENELDRSSFIIGIGGGIVCDITGYVASTYMRGIRFGFVSTTLLAQVDASTGGKNGVNFKGYKNMIGVFSQPEFVICDFEMLSSLPEEEYVAAYAEIIKHGAIQNAELFKFLEENVQKALNRDIHVIHRCVYDSLVIKSNVVQQDEKENGLRRMLNFGHTVGHAIEKLTGIIHGKAVCIGMVAAARLSEKKGYLSKTDADRIEKLISAFGLPTKIKIDKKQLFDSMKKDKKREKESINFVLLNGIGDIKIESIPLNQLEEIINDLC